jgi:hypothetical protein
MGRITIRTNRKKQLEIIIDKDTTAREILDGMQLYLETIGRMTGIEPMAVLEDLKSAMKNKNDNLSDK